MAKQVRETAAGKLVSAWVVLNRRGKHVATINAHYGASVSVDVWNTGNNAVENCWLEAINSGTLSKANAEKLCTEALAARDWANKNDAERWAAYEKFGMQQSSGSTLESALNGLVVDGVYLYDHCGKSAKSVAMLARYRKAMHAHPDHHLPHNYLAARGMQKVWDEKAKKIGASFANWSSNTNSYGSLHMYGGLRLLEELGYTVIQAM